MPRSFGLLVAILLFGSIGLTACVTSTTQQTPTPKTAHENALVTWQDSWKTLPSQQGWAGIETTSVSFSGNSGNAEYKTASGVRQVQLKSISSTETDCDSWKVSSTDSATGVEWRGLCNVNYSARSQDTTASSSPQNWTDWANNKDEMVCEKISGKWTCALGRGSMESLIEGTK